MEDFDRCLKTTNPIMISKVISKLMEVIKKKPSNETELKYLKEKCCNANPAIHQVAIKAILNLVETEVLDAEEILTDFITIITTTKCVSNMAYLVNNLLILDKNLKKNDYKCSFTLKWHPLIVILNENPENWSRIMDEIYLCYKNDNKTLINNYNKLYKVFFVYLICSPGCKLTQFKQKLWQFLLNSDVNLIDFLSWMQFQREDLILNSELLIKLTEFQMENNGNELELLLLLQSSLLYKIILNNFDPRSLIENMEKVVYRLDQFSITNSVLLILSKAITVCSSVYLPDLLKLCKLILETQKPARIIVESIKASLLQWIANPSVLTQNSIGLATELLLLTDMKKSQKIGRFFRKHSNFLITNKDVYISTQLCLLLEHWDTTDVILEWLDNLKNCSNFFLLEIVNFLYGLLLVNNSLIQLKIFVLLLKCSENSLKIKTELLILVLYCVTKTEDSQLHFKLLKSLPQLTNRENFQKIIATIQALSGTEALKNFAVSLMFDLWKQDNKCYPCLERLLIEPYQLNYGSKWEFYIVRARILRELCETKPELHGKDLVAHLSRILNECSGIDGSIACALAIEGIQFLCKYEIIDAVTTWATLAPLFQNERRLIVIRYLCKLIAEFPSLAYIEAHPKLIEEVVQKLWEYVMTHESTEVIEEALKSLSCFSLEQISLNFPKDCLEDTDLSNPISGHAWINLLKLHKNPRIIGNFLTKMVDLEIDAYLKYVYLVKDPREPANYKYLPQSSIVRALGNFVKSEGHKRMGFNGWNVVLECLRVLSRKYSKPLPPLDWCFLQELMQNDTREYCVCIAAHQVIISGTARRFMENYVMAVTENHDNAEEVLTIYRNLKYLANSIQPIILKPFVEITFKFAIKSFENNENLLMELLKYLKEILKNPEIQETNKVVISQILHSEIAETDLTSKLFLLLVESVTFFPLKLEEEIKKDFRKFAKIKCETILKNKNLNLLNELIEIGYLHMKEKTFVFQEIANIFINCRNETNSVLWILDLIGYIQAMITENFEIEKFLYFCDVFIWAIVQFSGYFVFIANGQDANSLFPQALALLLNLDQWSVCTSQALAWLYHMYNESKIPELYRKLFKRSIQALRNEEDFRKNMKWTNYLNCSI